MIDSLDEYRKMLEELCMLFIQALDDLKAKGMISEAEYIEHTETKRRFLENIN
ncbi:hypothetical protein OXPF_07930 [Oxobacter pfennigii]|uniref:Uncharacterized protein n=1 Tax=Oxobacter pfennigii TaxID=36849 RepID=A0A0N8NTR4_9CLOT|nr:hypothetical protein [Oxobacter pfennigii]KPU45560.1 hypothetical protein OXPF_07930 [Oxobacter pfennigii]